jgi:SAM-dependent methyltransferase
VEPAEYEAMHAQELRHWWFRGRRRVLIDALRTVVTPRSSSLQILDYGCGTGGNSSAYAQLGSVVGVEPDPAAIRLASQRGKARYCRGAGTELPFKDAVFDVVMASDVLEHIHNDVAAAAEIARVLRPRGIAIITVPAHPWLFSEHDAAIHHFRRYSKASFRNVLDSSGIKIRRLSYWNAALFPVICVHRLLTMSQTLRNPRSDTKSSPWIINEALTGLLLAEAAVLRHAPLPWGISLVAVAERV